MPPVGPEKPLATRKKLRLSGFDYRQPGIYFVTIYTWHRRCYFGDIVSDRSRSAIRLGQSLDLVEPGLDREIAVVEHHVARDAVVEEAHAELVIGLVVGGRIRREKGETHPP